MVHLGSNYLFIYYVRVSLGPRCSGCWCISPVSWWTKSDQQQRPSVYWEKEQNMKPLLLLLLLIQEPVGPFEILNTGLLHNFISAQSSFAVQDTPRLLLFTRLLLLLLVVIEWTQGGRVKKSLPINNSFSNRGRCCGPL